MSNNRGAVILEAPFNQADPSAAATDRSACSIEDGPSILKRNFRSRGAAEQDSAMLDVMSMDETSIADAEPEQESPFVARVPVWIKKLTGGRL